MAYEIPGFSHPLPAASDLTGSQFRFCNINSSGQATTPSAGGRVVGVRQNKPNTGEATTIVSSGISLVEAGEAITIGAAVTCAATGKAMVADGGDVVHGIAYTAASADGDLISVHLTPEGTAAPSSSVIGLPITLAGVTAADVLTAFTPGFAGSITKVQFAVTTAVTTGSKAATLNLEIGSTDVTGGVVALTSANCTPLGAVVAGTAVTAANVFGASDTISVEASSVTAFSEGAGVLFITIES